MSRYACGFERSSQSASVVVLNIDSGTVVYSEKLGYDALFRDR